MGDTHTIERTSPKGGDFIGRCTRCGKDGLSFSNMSEECANPSGETDEQSLIRAIEGGPTTDNDGHLPGPNNDPGALKPEPWLERLAGACEDRRMAKGNVLLVYRAGMNTSAAVSLDVAPAEIVATITRLTAERDAAEERAREFERAAGHRAVPMMQLFREGDDLRSRLSKAEGLVEAAKAYRDAKRAYENCEMWDHSIFGRLERALLRAAEAYDPEPTGES